MSSPCTTFLVSRDVGPRRSPTLGCADDKPCTIQASWRASPTRTLVYRTWTDAATRRTIEGDFVAVDGAKVVIKLDAGKTVRVSIARLIDADKVFIREQSAASAARGNEAPGGERKEAGAKTGPLTG